jgi:hypothetical protein
MVAVGANSSSPNSFFSLKLVKLSNSFLIVLMSLLMSSFFLESRPVVDDTLGSESVSLDGVEDDTVVAGASDTIESGLGEQVVELASPFSTLLNCCEDGTMVAVETVLVEVVVKTVGLVEDAVILSVDFNVGVTVAEGLVNAAGLLSLSTRGLMGTVIGVAEVPALLGKGRGLETSSLELLVVGGNWKCCLLDATGDKLEFCLLAI